MILKICVLSVPLNIMNIIQQIFLSSNNSFIFPFTSFFIWLRIFQMKSNKAKKVCFIFNQKLLQNSKERNSNCLHFNQEGTKNLQLFSFIKLQIWHFFVAATFCCLFSLWLFFAFRSALNWKNLREIVHCFRIVSGFFFVLCRFV